MSIAENVARIRAEMEAAALSCGRDPSQIQLCAATKMNDADAVREAILAGVDCCGENRVQELVQKQISLGISQVEFAGMTDQSLKALGVYAYMDLENGTLRTI